MRRDRKLAHGREVFRLELPLEAQDEKAPYGRWAFLADGATEGNGVVENWFELLDSWFDQDPKADGGLNRYRW